MRSNTWWFVWEVEYADEGAQLVAALSAEDAEANVRATMDGDVELASSPADDLDTIVQWIRSVR